MAQAKPSLGDRVRRFPPARYAMLAFGWICVGFGIVGVFLPVWPSTVFFLLALWAFSNSSQRFHNCLYTHPRFGATARARSEHRIIPVQAKVLAVLMMSVSAGILVWLADTWILPAAVGAGLAIIASWIVTRPSRLPE